MSCGDCPHSTISRTVERRGLVANLTQVFKVKYFVVRQAILQLISVLEVSLPPTALDHWAILYLEKPEKKVVVGMLM